MKRPASRARAVALAIVATGTCATAGETQTDSGRPYTAADVHFMAGMVARPTQAEPVFGGAPDPRGGPAQSPRWARSNRRDTAERPPAQDMRRGRPQPLPRSRGHPPT